MKRIPKVVLDTNVFISAFILQKNSFRIAEAWQRGLFRWIISPPIKKEYFSVISYPKFHQTEKELAQIKKSLEELIHSGLIEQVLPLTKISIVDKDLDDNKFIECAFSVSADFIVSGDKHLLEIERFKSISIISPSTFLEYLPSF